MIRNCSSDAEHPTKSSFVVLRETAYSVSFARSVLSVEFFFPKKAGETVGSVQGQTELHVKFAELLSTKFLFISRKRIRLPKMPNFTPNSPHSLIPEPILWLAHELAPSKQQQKHFQMFSQGLQTLGFSVVQGGWAVANACLQKHCF